MILIFTLKRLEMWFSVEYFPIMSPTLCGQGSLRRGTFKCKLYKLALLLIDVFILCISALFAYTTLDQ